MKDFHNLQVWEKAHALVLAVYRNTAAFPPQEAYGLTNQTRRAAVSIPANIAEGCGRQSEADFARFLQISMGSASEVEYHLLLAHDLGFLEDSIYADLNRNVIEIKRMLAALLKTLRADNR